MERENEINVKMDEKTASSFCMPLDFDWGFCCLGQVSPSRPSVSSVRQISVQD